MNNIKYFLTPNEFSVISAGFGISTVYGLKQIDGQLDNKEICVALHNMYVNQLIDNKDSTQFVAEPDITDMMRQIKAAERFILVNTTIDRHASTFCIYPGDRCAVLEETGNVRNKIIMHLVAWENVTRYIIEKSVGSPMEISLVSAKNGQVLKNGVIDETADRQTRTGALENCYKEAQGNDTD